jgi:hypothetical protein
MKKELVFIFLFFISISSWCITIAVAPFNVYAEGETVQITDMEKTSSNFVYQFLSKERYAKLIKFVDVSEKKDVPSFVVKTEKEADELCIYLGCDYLVFGYVKKTNLYYDVELRIYNFEKKEVVGIVYDRHETNDFLFMIKELSAKTSSKIMEITKTQKEATKKQTKFYLSNYIGVYNAVGYWIPFPDWWTVETGIVSGETGIKVVRLPSLYTNKNLAINLRPGLVFSYSFGLNKTGFLETYYHQFLFKFPIDFNLMLFNEKIGVITGFGVQVQFDFMYQLSKYRDPLTNQSVAFSMFASTGFEYWIDKKNTVCIGLNNIFDFTFYKDFFSDYKIEIYNIVKIPEAKNKEETQ